MTSGGFSAPCWTRAVWHICPLTPQRSALSTPCPGSPAHLPVHAPRTTYLHLWPVQVDFHLRDDARVVAFARRLRAREGAARSCLRVYVGVVSIWGRGGQSRQYCTITQALHHHVQRNGKGRSSCPSWSPATPPFLPPHGWRRASRVRLCPPDRRLLGCCHCCPAQKTPSFANQPACPATCHAGVPRWGLPGVTRSRTVAPGICLGDKEGGVGGGEQAGKWR